MEISTKKYHIWGLVSKLNSRLSFLPPFTGGKKCLEFPIHAWPYGRFIEIQRNLKKKKLHRTNQSSNFLGSSFSSRDNVRAPIQFRRENQSQHFKRWFFLKNRPIHFHINSTSVIRLVKRNQLSFCSGNDIKKFIFRGLIFDWHCMNIFDALCSTKIQLSFLYIQYLHYLFSK